MGHSAFPEDRSIKQSGEEKKHYCVKLCKLTRPWGLAVLLEVPWLSRSCDPQGRVARVRNSEGEIALVHLVRSSPFGGC